MDTIYFQREIREIEHDVIQIYKWHVSNFNLVKIDLWGHLFRIKKYWKFFRIKTFKIKKLFFFSIGMLFFSIDFDLSISVSFPNLCLSS